MFGSLVPYQCGEIATDVFWGRGGGIIRKMKCPERWCKKRACDIGETKDKTVKAQKQEQPEKAEAQQESPATLEGIRALMAQKTQEGKSKEIKELLQKYGAAKLSAVKPEDYPALMQEAQVL